MKILVIHTFGLGDIIMFTPALTELHNLFPDAEIDFFVREGSVQSILKRIEYVRSIYHTDYRLSGLTKLVLLLRKKNYDFSLVTSGINPIKASIFSYLVHARVRVGEYIRRKNICYNANVYYEEYKHRVENNLSLVRALESKTGVKSNVSTFFPLNAASIDYAKSRFLTKKDHKIILGVHPGSRISNLLKRWPSDYFIEVIDSLKRRYSNIEIILFIGPDEQREGKYIAGMTDVTKVINESLDTVAALISLCHYFLCTDSGLGHIASCFNTRVFTIFGATKDYKIAPFTKNLQVIKLGMTCQPCYGRKGRRCRGVDCLMKLTPGAVIDKLTSSMDKDDLLVKL